jgi:hypothetical protein
VSLVWVSVPAEEKPHRSLADGSTAPRSQPGGRVTPGNRLQAGKESLVRNIHAIHSRLRSLIALPRP